MSGRTSSSNNRLSSIVITGFMGTGKTSVGRLVAERLAREFLDVDSVIEAREGTTVSAIFRNRGEEYFRAREAELAVELGSRDGLVIATGGGTLVNDSARAAFKNALVVCLDATPEAILGRLEGANDRPMLAAAQVRGRIDELLEVRRQAYGQIEHHVDTTDKRIEQVAEEIVELALVERIDVPTPEGKYSALVGIDLIGQVGAMSSELAHANRFSKRCAVVTNPQVGALYAARLVDSLRSHGLEPTVVEIPEGEHCKTLATTQMIYDQLVEARLDRRSILFALGGGVVGDIAGFAAATYLRGIPFVQIPTTLLAMVDASIGGKVAVDHPRGKNLIGAFKQPCAVIADASTLTTLPAAEFASGMGEVVKHGIIGDPTLFEMLERNPRLAGQSGGERTQWLARAIRVKVDVVARDPFEQGERGKLNLGHTFAHAFENLSGYSLRHGDAVAIGLFCAARLSTRRRMCAPDFPERIEALLTAIGLPTRVPGEMSANAILDVMATDKKRVDARLRFILPRGLGDVVIADDVEPTDVAAVLEETRK